MKLVPTAQKAVKKESLYYKDQEFLMMYGDNVDGQASRRSRVEGSPHLSMVRRFALRVVNFRWFEFMMSLIILVNCCGIGMEIEFVRMKKSTIGLQFFEHICLTIYIVELGLRVIADTWQAFRSRWIWFDALLVISGILSNWIIEPFLSNSKEQEDEERDFMDQVLLLRILRVARLSRSLRLVHAFKPLWKITQGLMNSFAAMMSVMLLILFVIYVAACIGTELIAGDPQLSRNADSAQVVEQFNSLPTAMLTLIRFVSLDGLAAMYEPLIRRKPLLMLYFLVLIWIVSIAMMNLITALIIEESMEANRANNKDQANVAKRKLNTLKPVLRELYDTLNTDGGDELCFHEMLHCVDKNIPKELTPYVNPVDLIELFEFLDRDGSGP